jgi:hypothetical protein
MPLPKSPPALVQAPAWAGVGLEFPERVAEPGWPVDWWQRDLDSDRDDPDDEPPPPLTEREMHVPPPPVVIV